MRRVRRTAAALAAVALVGGLAVALEESPAAADKVANPGSSFSLRVHTGELVIGDQGFSFVDEGRQPQCSDGSNNDGAQDSARDYPADPQCSSAADDSETAPGLQPKRPIQLNGGTVDAEGNITFPTSGVSFPQQYLFVAASDASGGLVDDFIVRLTISAIAPFTGTVNPLTGAMDLRMRVRVDADNHGGGPLDSGCSVAPIDINSAVTGTSTGPGPKGPLTGSPLDNSTGRVTLVNTSYEVPGASGCGTVAVFVDLDDQVNSQLGLPSPAGRNTASFTGEFTPIRPQPAVVASFTASPSSGPAPLHVSFDAGASVGSGKSYRWDLDGNGTFDPGVTSATPSFTYATPGNRTVRLRVSDSDGESAETTRLIQVGANQPPTAHDQAVSTPEDTPKAVTLTATDPEGSAITFARGGVDPAHGSATCSSDGACTYVPDADFAGSDTFGFTATDAFGNSDSALVTVTVSPLNDAPTASDVSATVVEDGSGPVTLLGNDPDGDALTYAVVTPPGKGTLSGSGASLTYTPQPDASGPDTFTYQVTDTSGATSGLATATVQITPVNDAPLAQDGSATTAEDTPVAVTLSASDVDGDHLTYSIVSLPSGGSLSGSAPNLTFTPAADFNGSTSFTFRATDAAGASDTAVVSLTVHPVNDAPTTSDVSVATSQAAPVDVAIVADDPDGDALTYTPGSASNGTVSCAAEVCTYTPDDGFSGTDAFEVVVSDPGGLSATSAVTVGVSALDNATPVIDDATVAVLEDEPRTFTLASADSDGDPRTHEVLVAPTLGSLACDPGGTCTYQPAPDTNGDDTFVVSVSDGRGGVDTATITVSVAPVNDAPLVAEGQSLVTSEDSTGTVALGATDADGDALTWTVKRHPLKGSIDCDPAGACTYTPAADANGSDSFDVEVDDGHGARVRVTIPITIEAVDDPAVAGVVSRVVDEDGGPDSFSLVGSDPDGGPVTFAADGATNGSLTCNADGSCTFVPAPDANGTETVPYTVADSAGSATGAVVITIVPANDAPQAGTLTLGTAEDTPVSFSLPATDADPGDTIAYHLTGAPALGTLSGTPPDLSYSPAPGASGTVSFGFVARDAAGAASPGTVTITVVPVDDLPVAGSTSVTTPEDTAVAVDLTGSDEEGEVTVAVIAGPSHGTYAGGVYTPALDHHGPDAIEFTVTDGAGQTVAGTVGITVTPVNDPPVATDLAVTTTRTAPVHLTLAASDPDGDDSLTYTVVTGPSKGTLSGSAPDLNYTPTGFITGDDVVTFEVRDGSGATDTATVAITIEQGPALPTQQVVEPADVTRPGGLLWFLFPNTYQGLSTTLTTTSGLPVSGQWVGFYVDGRLICGAKTNADGVATCGGSGPNVAVSSYTASFVGTAAFAHSSATGPLS